MAALPKRRRFPPFYLLSLDNPKEARPATTHNCRPYLIPVSVTTTRTRHRSFLSRKDNVHSSLWNQNCLEMFNDKDSPSTAREQFLFRFFHRRKRFLFTKCVQIARLRFFNLDGTTMESGRKSLRCVVDRRATQGDPNFGNFPFSVKSKFLNFERYKRGQNPKKWWSFRGKKHRNFSATFKNFGNVQIKASVAS